MKNDCSPLSVLKKALRQWFTEMLSEAVDIGLEDYLYSGNLCLMEWPENVEELLPEDTLKVHIKVNPDLSRTVWWEE